MSGTGLSKTDPIFNELTTLQPTLAKTNQPLIAALISLFGEFREKILTDIQTNIDTSVAELKAEFVSAIQAKDAKINELETTCCSLKKTVESLEDKMDGIEAYERRDSIIISGALPPIAPEEDVKILACNLIKTKFGSNIQITPNDISVAHRLQAKQPSPQGSPRHPNIYAKLVRRDLKKDLILASKNQNKAAPSKIFINESLTPQRAAVLRTLVKLKRDHEAIRGVTSIEGEVYAFTPAPPPAEAARNLGGERRRRDIRHRINNRRQLLKFCNNFLKEALEDFANAWPEN